MVERETNKRLFRAFTNLRACHDSAAYRLGRRLMVLDWRTTADCLHPADRGVDTLSPRSESPLQRSNKNDCVFLLLIVDDINRTEKKKKLPDSTNMTVADLRAGCSC